MNPSDSSEAPPRRPHIEIPLHPDDVDYCNHHYGDDTWRNLDVDLPPWPPLPRRDILEYSVRCGSLHADCPPAASLAGDRTSTRLAGAPIRIVCTWQSHPETMDPADLLDAELLADFFPTIEFHPRAPVVLSWLVIDEEGKPVPHSCVSMVHPATSPVTALTGTEPVRFNVASLVLHWKHVAMVRFDELELPRLRRFNLGIYVYWTRRTVRAWEKGDVPEGGSLPDEDYSAVMRLVLARDACKGEGNALDWLMEQIPDTRARTY